MAIDAYVWVCRGRELRLTVCWVSCRPRALAPIGPVGLPASFSYGLQAVSALNKMGCAGFADARAELALGVLTGRERAEALAHLGHCAACQENVRQLMMKGEQLVQLLPAKEPPSGFDTRVLERLRIATLSPDPGQASRMSPTGERRRSGHEAGEGKPRRHRGPRRVLAAVAVALVAAVSALGGWGLDAATSSSASSSLSSASLFSASHQTVGTIFFYGGSEQWLSMSVNLRSGTGSVTCQLVRPDGHVMTLGSFWLDAGYGTWASPGSVGHAQFTSVRLVRTDGTVLATASLPQR
jgi:hypothetical protein